MHILEHIPVLLILHACSGNGISDDEMSDYLNNRDVYLISLIIITLKIIIEI